MPDANAHPADMFTVTPDTLPRFWWLNPWLTAKRLHTACVALRELADRESDRAMLYRGAYENAKVIISNRDRTITTLTADTHA